MTVQIWHGQVWCVASIEGLDRHSFPILNTVAGLFLIASAVFLSAVVVISNEARDLGRGTLVGAVGLHGYMQEHVGNGLLQADE